MTFQLKKKQIWRIKKNIEIKKYPFQLFKLEKADFTIPESLM